MKLNPQLEKDLKELGISQDKDLTKEDLSRLLSSVNKSYNNQELFDSVLDHTPCTVSWINSDLTYAGVNARLADMMGKSKADFIGMSLGEMTKDSRFQDFSKKLFDSNCDKLTDQVESVINGVRKHYFVVGKKYHEGEKAVVIGMDITELKAIEEDNIFSEKLKTLGEMSATIIHEINNPLNTINFLSFHINELIKAQDLKKDEVANNIQVIQETVQSISKIIQGLKKFSRNTSTDEIKPCDLQDVIASSCLVSKGKAKEHKVSIKQKNIPKVKILANEVQIYQVLINMMNNSVEAVADQKDKWIEISGDETENSIILKIKDSGSGIDPTVAEKIFDPFFSTKPLGVGTGIGLDLSKRIIEKHKGSITVDPSCENTCFIIELPKAS